MQGFFYLTSIIAVATASVFPVAVSNANEETALDSAQTLKYCHSKKSEKAFNSSHIGECRRLSQQAKETHNKLDFYNPSDGVATTPNLVQTIDNDNEELLHFNTLFQNRVLARRSNGPTNASVALGITSVKPDFRTSTSSQEADGLYIQTKTGLHGDTSAILADAAGITGGTSFINIIEGTASTVSAQSGLPTKSIRYQAGLIDQKNSISAGMNIVSETGVLDYGILMQSDSLNNKFKNFVSANTANKKKWSVDSEGNEYLAGATVTSEVSTRVINLKEISQKEVENPQDGIQILFIDSDDHRLKRKDSNGRVTIIG